MKNFRDEELKKWLAEEYYRETDEMEKTLFPDGNIPEYEETEEEARAAYARLVERLKADGVYEEDNSDKIVYLPVRKRNRFVHVAAVAVVCISGVFAASMTSQANRNYFIDSIRLWTGNDTSITVGNDENTETDSSNEENAITEIEQELGVDVPKFMYRPEGFEFKDYKVSEEIGYAWMEYSYGKTVVSVYINNYTDSTKNSNYLLDGELIGTLKTDGSEIKIIEVKDKNDVTENYAAYWEQKGTFYQVSGKIEKEKFMKLIKELYF